MPRRIWLLVLFTVLSFESPSFGQDAAARDVFLRTRKSVDETKESTSPSKLSSGNERVRRRPRPGEHDIKTKGTGPKQEASSQGSEERPKSARPAGDAIGLGYTLFLKNGHGDLLRVSPTRTFQTGQAVRLLLESNIDGYLYILHQENDGQAKMLFPTWIDQQGDNHIWLHEPIVVPAENEIAFVGNPATETLTVIVSRKPIAGLPVGEHLKGRSRVTVPSAVFEHLSQACSCREATQDTEGELMTDSENRRDVELKKADPVPAHILLSQSKNEGRLVTRIRLIHR